MKKAILLTLIVSALSLHFAVAAENTNPTLIPASSLEEMMNSNIDENSTVANFDEHFRDHHEGRVLCFVRNGRGERFEGRGAFPREALDEALRECRRVSEHCFEL